MTKEQLIRAYEAKARELPTTIEGYAMVDTAERERLRKELFDLSWAIGQKRAESHWLTWFGVKP